MQRTHNVVRILTICTFMIAIASTAHAQLSQAQVLQFVGRYIQRPAALDKSAAESVSYDPATKTAVFTDANVNKLTFVNMANPATPVFVRDILLAPYGGTVNSVSIKNGMVAVAIEDGVLRQNPGKVLLFSTSGTFLNSILVGAIPDMVTFTPDGTRIVVCNEAEPSNDYVNDPEGSVSIINVSGGAATATVQTATFTALNSKKDSLKALGVRFLSPTGTVAQDLEPEYATISADSKTAYVTLQEANALAIVDIATATITRVVALGYKDYSKGLPQVKQYPFQNLPVLGTTTAGQDIRMGGFSGLWFEGYADAGQTKLRFLTHPDRGPNAEPATLRGAPRRPFALPNMQLEVLRFEFDRTTGSITLLNRIPLFRTDGVTPISGRPNMQAAGQGMAYTDEYGVDLFGNDIPNDPFGGDMEGIAVDASGTWWMVDEYRPAIYNFASNGTLIARYVPQGTGAANGVAAGTYGTEVLPAVYAQRRSNRGFEAVAIEGNKLYAFIQSPIDNPDDPTDKASKASTWCRIIEMDLTTKTITGEYLYPMFEKAAGADKIGDAASMGNGKFMVIERDDATGLKAVKYVWEINLRTATNLLTTSYTLPLGRTLESLTMAEVAALGIRPVAKRKAVYLPGAGYGDFEKVEGLARVDNNTFLLVNDNDFGIGGSTLATPPNGRIAINPASVPVLGLLTFDRPNGLDASDRDGGINITNWPVFGTYQPDAIANFTVNGQTFLVTANEGDARDFTTPTDEYRINTTNVVLDPTAFPNAAALKTDAQLGRLRISIPTGDLDGDGDLDEMHAYGARSFSVWNTDGNLIWDSGNEFETRTAAFYPTMFNTNHSANGLDARSPNKGPEPEGIAVGTIGDSIYAFIGLERIGHTFMYNITSPNSPKYIDYINSRDVTVTPSATTIDNGTVGDLGPEVLAFISAAESPTGADMLIAGNEVSGTMSAYTIRIPRITSVPPSSLIMCVNDVMSLSVTATGPSLTYQWMKDGVDIAGATSSVFAPTIGSASAAGMYQCKVRAAGGMTITTSATTVAVFTRTTITKEPVAFTQLDEGASVILSCDATSTAGETYQWYRAGVALTDGGRLSGVRTKALTIKGIQFSDTSSAYYCVVKGGCSTVRTRDAAVLIPRVLITEQPASADLCPGDSVSFRTRAVPSGGDVSLTYQWRRNGQALVNGGAYSGATTSVLKIVGAAPALSGEYTCSITGLPSKEPMLTAPATLVVADAPIITKQPRGQNGTSSVDLCDGRTATLSVVAAGLVQGYQWFLDGQPVAGATLPFYAAQREGSYTVAVKGACSAASTLSTPVTIRSNVKPTLQRQPAPSMFVTVGTPLTLRVVLLAGTPPVTYQWYKNGAALNGATQATYTIASAVAEDGGRYACIITNSCGDVTTDGTVVTVQDPVSVAEVSHAAVTCTVMPNPVTDDMNLHVTVPVSGRLRMVLTTAHGVDVATLYDATTDAGLHVIRSSMGRTLAAGVYMVRVETAAGTFMRSVAITH